MESDYGGYFNIIGNRHMISGLKMASKVFTIIYDAELGKPDALPKRWGRNSARSHEGVEGRGYDKKRMPIGDRPDRGFLPQPEKVLTYHWYLIV